MQKKFKAKRDSKEIHINCQNERLPDPVPASTSVHSKEFNCKIKLL